MLASQGLYPIELVKAIGYTDQLRVSAGFQIIEESVRNTKPTYSIGL
jgi:hypothetical protein